MITVQDFENFNEKSDYLQLKIVNKTTSSPQGVC